MARLCAEILFVICCMCSSLAYRSTPGYVFKHDPYIYKIVIEKYDKRTWVEARKICQEEENGELLTYGDPKEAAWVNRLVANLTGEMGYLGRFWMGATDKRLRGVYEYIDDSPFKYREAPWAKGEPNRPKGFEYNYCIVTETKDKSPEWSDEDCFKSFGYICKSRDAPRRLRAVQRFGYSWEWNYYDYKFVILPDDSMTWSEAEIYCQEAESGHLLSIYNSKESEWVTDRIRQIRQVLGFQELWIGATDIFSKGQFKWTDEKPVNYTKWRNGTANILAARKPREACVSILAHPNWGDWNEEYCIKKLPFVCKTKKCQGKSDLAFIVDASGSVTSSGFEQAKSFMFQVIRGFQVTNNQTNIAIIGFSDDAEIIFGFNKHYGQLQLKKAIDRMPFTKGETYTNKALDLARTAVFSKYGNSRDGVPKIALLMTDGKSKIPLKTALAAKKLKQEGVTLVPLGIGNGADRKELLSMASNYKDVLYVESYAHLGAKVKDIRQRVCDEIIRVGLEQAKIRAAEEKQRIAFEAKQRLEAERRRKMSEEQKKREDARKRKLEEERKKQEEKRKKEQERKRQEEAKKREAQRKRQRNTQNRNNQRNRNTLNRNTKNRNTQNRNNQNRYNQNRNTQNRNNQNRYNQNRNTQNRNTQNRNNQNRYNQNRNTQNRNNQNRYNQNRNTQNRNNQNRYNQNRNTQNRNNQNRYNQNRNTQNRNIQNRYNQNRNTQNRYNQRNRNTQNRYNQRNRNTQNRYNQRNRNTQNRNIQNRYNQNRYNQRNRNTQNRYNQRNRNTQNRYTQRNRNTQNRYNQRNRNTQNRNTQNRNTQNRYNQNRYNRNRNTQNRNRYQG